MRCLRPSLRPWTSGVLSCPRALALPSCRCRGDRPSLLTEGGAAGADRGWACWAAHTCGWHLRGRLLLKGGGAPCSGSPQPPPAAAPLSPTRLWGHGLPAFPWNLPFLDSGGRRLPLCFCALLEDNSNETSLLEASLHLYEPGEGPAQPGCMGPGGRSGWV